MKLVLLCYAWLLSLGSFADELLPARNGVASWYGETHRGRLMANGKKFDPDQLTAASWLYPLGTRVLVTRSFPADSARSVVVTIADRGPAQRLVRQGRIIDLSRAAFRKLAAPDTGLVEIKVEPLFESAKRQQAAIDRAK